MTTPIERAKARVAQRKAAKASKPATKTTLKMQPEPGVTVTVTRIQHHPGCNCKDCNAPNSQTKSLKSQSGSSNTDTAGRVARTKQVADISTDKPKPTATQQKPRKKKVTTKATVREVKTKGGIIIQAPGHAFGLFEHKVCVYSTCRDCGQLMHVIDAFEHVHPMCTPRPTYVETLAMGWLSAVNADDKESADLTQQEIDKLDGQAPDMKAAAMQYASWGWPIFPLLPHGYKSKRTGEVGDGKKPATQNGFKDATTSLGQINRWWNRQPDLNIGLPTGKFFDALDVDPDGGGVESFLNLLRDKRIPETHAVVVTSSGGIHLYLKPTGKGNRAKFLPGLDYRGKGGYVVAPPSITTGRDRAWSWLTVPSPKIKEGEFN